MHIQIGAHTMTCAMQVVQSLPPHILAGQNVDLGAAGAAGELAEFYLNMSLQYQGVDFLFFLCQWSECDGTGDVRCAVEILGTAVEQQHTFRLQGDIRLWRRFVVYDGGVFTIAGNRVEGDVTIQRLFCTKARQLLIDTNLCQF